MLRINTLKLEKWVKAAGNIYFRPIRLQRNSSN